MKEEARYKNIKFPDRPTTALGIVAFLSTASFGQYESIQESSNDRLTGPNHERSIDKLSELYAFNEPLNLESTDKVTVSEHIDIAQRVFLKPDNWANPSNIPVFMVPPRPISYQELNASGTDAYLTTKWQIPPDLASIPRLQGALAYSLYNHKVIGVSIYTDESNSSETENPRFSYDGKAFVYYVVEGEIKTKEISIPSFLIEFDGSYQIQTDSTIDSPNQIPDKFNDAVLKCLNNDLSKNQRAEQSTEISELVSCALLYHSTFRALSESNPYKDQANEVMKNSDADTQNLKGWAEETQKNFKYQYDQKFSLDLDMIDFNQETKEKYISTRNSVSTFTKMSSSEFVEIYLYVENILGKEKVTKETFAAALTDIFTKANDTYEELRLNIQEVEKRLDIVKDANNSKLELLKHSFITLDLKKQLEESIKMLNQASRKDEDTFSSALDTFKTVQAKAQKRIEEHDNLIKIQSTQRSEGGDAAQKLRILQFIEYGSLLLGVGIFLKLLKKPLQLHVLRNTTLRNLQSLTRETSKLKIKTDKAQVDLQLFKSADGNSIQGITLQNFDELSNALKKTEDSNNEIISFLTLQRKTIVGSSIVFSSSRKAALEKIKKVEAILVSPSTLSSLHLTSQLHKEHRQLSKIIEQNEFLIDATLLRINLFTPGIAQVRQQMDNINSTHVQLLHRLTEQIKKSESLSLNISLFNYFKSPVAQQISKSSGIAHTDPLSVDSQQLKLLEQANLSFDQVLNILERIVDKVSKSNNRDMLSLVNNILLSIDSPSSLPEFISLANKLTSRLQLL